MKKSTIYVIAIILSLALACVSSICMAKLPSVQSMFGILAVIFAATFTLFTYKLTSSDQ